MTRQNGSIQILLKSEDCSLKYLTQHEVSILHIWTIISLQYCKNILLPW